MTIAACGLAVVTPFSALAVSNPCPSPTVSGSGSITAQVFGSPLVISTSTQFAGAIESLTWNGVQFINSFDHGRELQSAVSFDGYGECYNPTEAGSDDFSNAVYSAQGVLVKPATIQGDGTGPTSSSCLYSLSANANVLTTTSQMAFWTPPGQVYATPSKVPVPGSTPSPVMIGCSGKISPPAPDNAVNTTNLSSEKLTKVVTIGYAGIQNVIQYQVTLETGEAHSSAVFEALTGYMPGTFSQFYTFKPDVPNAVPSPLAAPNQEQGLPLILATNGGTSAMGIYSPSLPLPNWPNLGYGLFAFPNSDPAQATNKWNMVFRNNATPIGSYSATLYLVVGSLSQVVTGMQALYDQLHPVMGNVDGVVGGTVEYAPAPHGRTSIPVGITNTTINGWACSYGVTNPISVDLYLNAPAGGSYYTYLGRTLANLPSEAAVAQSCGTAGTAYRFSIPVTTSQFEGDQIYVYGISPNDLGSANNLLGTSVTNRIAGANVLPVFQYFNNMDWYYSTGSSPPAGYLANGEVFSLSSTNPAGNLVPIYNCFTGVDHFLSTSSNCEGAQTTAPNNPIFIQGYAYGTNFGLAPLYRFRDAAGFHFESTSLSQGTNNGYTLEGVLGYVWP